MGALARVGFDDRCAASKACYEGRVDAAKRSVDERARARSAAARPKTRRPRSGARRATAVASAKKKSREEGDVPSAGIRGFIRRTSEDMSPAGQEKLDHDWKRAQAAAAVVACGGEPEFRVWSALKRANDEATAAEQAAHGQAAQQLVNACEAKAGEAKAFRMDADAARSSAPRARAAADKARGAADACAALAAQARAGGTKGAMLTPSRQKSMKQWNADKGVATPEGGFDAFDRASAYYRTKDSADGMALREQCEAFARNCAVECADAKAHVHKFNENTPQGTKKASSGTTKMHALNMAAACVKRAADMAAQASELAEVAIQRAIDMKKKGAPRRRRQGRRGGHRRPRRRRRRAFDAQNAARAFKTTSKIGRA
ncbi:hypothetical protein JL720_3093 [Aureococcus anophagefferens]|nr:hypothetical protein JL720_3093 [Aureococcus anophagefferens]